MQTSIIEQRFDTRTPVNFEVLCSANNRPAVITGKITNMSGTGLLLWASSFLSVGDEIYISMPVASKERKTSGIAAIVTRIYQQNNSGKIGYGCTYAPA